MVFPGTLSRGCSRCRKRKIKCDGRRPGCRRCELYKAPCPGYDRPLAFRFHGEPGQSLVRDEPGSSSAKTLVLGIGLGYEKARSKGSGVCRQPQPSFEDESISYFLHEYCVLPAPGVIKGHLDFLEGMYRSSSRTSCIRPALLAAAHMSLSRHYKSSTLYVTARYHYGAALRTVNRDLSASKRPLKDETLASLMLLGMIEDIECQGQTTKAVHMAGISNMDAETQNKQIPSLMAKDDMDCLVIPDSQLDTSNPVIRLALVITRIGQFYRAARRITSADSTSTPNKQRELLVPVIQEALAIGAELAMIEKAMPTRLQPQQTADKRPATPNNKPLVSFQSRWTACTWVFFNMYLILFFGRLHICAATLLRLVDSKSSPQVQLAQTTATIAEKQVVSMTQRLCSVLPYLMGEVNELSSCTIWSGHLLSPSKARIVARGKSKSARPGST
ncbi:Arginine metabolism regulation protein II [Fusarium oxysporum f. sp. cubense race 1]|uniref:Arginine metabolism regulation protein II n=1 Tax=Fusarium oxysporum f. sp. cubense (strain race 1) TaxID=1229664 RepID=N4U784_FUSC1|nr:Arginine metabolism regulation protein II [Fusarium oxysporum f. sp. cubense race 1]